MKTNKEHWIVFVAICGTLAGAPPAGAQEAALHDGRPAFLLTSVSGELNTHIDYVAHHGEAAFRFLVVHDLVTECKGYLYVSRSGVRYEPFGSTPKHEDDAFHIMQDEIEAVSRSAEKGYSWLTFRLKKREYLFSPGVFDRQGQIFATKNWRFIVDFSSTSIVNFDKAVSQFKEITADLPGRRFFPRPLSAEQTAAVESAESKARVTERAGRSLEALGHYLAAVKALPEAPDLEVDGRIRRRLIELVAKLEAPPSPPEEARRRMAYAVTALEGATTAAQYDKALVEFYRALKSAPWWAPLYFNTGMVLEQGGYLASARSHLQLYLLAAPNAEDRDTVQQKIYSLEYKMRNQ